MFKSYKYRLYPTKKQEILLEKHFGSVRFIYNLALETKNYTWLTSRKYLSYLDLQKQLTELKKETDWLNEVNSQSLQASLHNLDDAFTNFFKGRAKFPKYKSKYDKQSFYIPQNVKIISNKLSIPKFKESIKLILSREIAGEIKNATITKNKAGQYFVSILSEIDISIPKKKEIKETTSIGIDLGLKDFITTSDGKKVKYSFFYNKFLTRLQKLQQILSKKQNGSNNKKKLQYKITRLHNDIKNKRYDFQQKLSTELIKNHDTIIVETLDIKELTKRFEAIQDKDSGKFLPNGQTEHSIMTRSILDASWFQFTSMLKYKCEWYGKNFIQVGTFEPSSKTCSCCGWKKSDLSLSERTWICKKCNVVHDRDINAAQNIKSFGLIRNIAADLVV